MTLDEMSFEREKLCYEQNFQQMRSLNDQMNRIPTIGITLTGGLWYGASLTQNIDLTIRFGLIVLAGVCNLALILACIRTRDVMMSYMEKLKTFAPSNYASGRPEKPVLAQMSQYSMITVYCFLLGIVSGLSFLGAISCYWPFSIPNWWGILGFLVFLGATCWLFLSKPPEKV